MIDGHWTCLGYRHWLPPLVLGGASGDTLALANGAVGFKALVLMA